VLTERERERGRERDEVWIFYLSKKEGKISARKVGEVEVGKGDADFR